MTRARDVADRNITANELDLTDNYAFTGTVTGISAGKILQFLNFPFSTQVTTNSTSFISLGSPAIQGSITPSSTSSKILINFTTSVFQQGTNKNAYVTIFRGTAASGTNLGSSSEGFVRLYHSGGQTVDNVTIECVDTPNTTSAVTYQLGFRSSDTTIHKFMMNNTPAQLIIMEIEA